MKWPEQTANIIIKLNQVQRKQFEAWAKDTIHHQFYKYLNFNLGDATYQSDQNSLQFIRVTMRAREDVINLNYNPWSAEGIECCLCNAKEKEDLWHFLANCSSLGEIGKYHLGYFKVKKENLIYYVNG